MIIGTAGHIDHGKTSLVKRLTGVDTDRLPEEKKRGITIELGFAYTKSNEQDILGFVDVPGHEKFINTMVSGAIGIDHGLLVIAADDGIMPQTIEHLRILEFLQIDSISVVITKIDVVDLIRVNQVSLDIQKFLASSRFLSVKIFPVSSYTGQGIAELKGYLSQLKISTAYKTNGFRLAVDRVFITKGMGVTVTGAIQSGSVSGGDELLLMPDHLPVKVRSIHAQGQSAEIATSGNRCGLVLSGVELGEVRRGQWLVSPHLMQGVERFDARIDLSKDARFVIKDGDILLLYHGTDFTSARLILLEKNQLNPGESTLVQCVLQKPLSMCWSDRFILRDTSARYTLAGGVVLDIYPPLRNRKIPDRFKFLQALFTEDAKVAFTNLLNISKLPVSLQQWSSAFNIPIDQLIELTKNNSVITFQNGQEIFAIQESLFQNFQNVIQEYLKKNHEENPDSDGLHIGQLRSIFKPKMDMKLFSLLLKELLAKQKIYKLGPKYLISTQGFLFNTQEQVVWDKCKTYLENFEFNPPNLRELIKEIKVSEPVLKNVFYKAIRQHLIVQVGQDIYYPIAAMKRLAKTLEAIFEEKQQITVIDVRDQLKIGRNRVILIIETFDRMGFTHRIIKQTKSKEVIDYRIIKNPNVLNHA